MPEEDLVPPVPPPESQLGYLLVRLAHALSQRWTRELSPFGLSARQHGALAALAARPQISAGALAREAIITPQSMGELLAGLEERGLVLRRLPAGRGHPAQLELTDAGRALLVQVKPVVESSNSPEELGLTQREIDHLRDLLVTMLGTVTEGPAARRVR